MPSGAQFLSARDAFRGGALALAPLGGKLLRFDFLYEVTEGVLGGVAVLVAKGLLQGAIVDDPG